MPATLPGIDGDDASAEEFARPPLKTRWKIFWGLGLLIAIVCAVASLVSTPYTAFTLGGVNPIEDLVEIEGAEAYPTEGELFYTTVRLNRLNAFEYVAIRLKPAVDIRRTEEVFGTQSSEESTQCSAQMMQTSQSTANIVALTYLGYEVFEPTGVTVDRVFDESAADNVIECGDVIIGLNGAPTMSTLDLRDAVLAQAAGDTVEVEIERDGDTEVVDLTLGAADDGSPLIGVSIGTRLQENDLPVDLSLTIANVGGPSAGLAFTLSYIDLLTEGELTGGLDVAVTGEMFLNGAIGPVGGVRQKVAAAIRADADLMLIPGTSDRLVEVALAEAGDDIEVVPVSTLDEAIQALADRGGNGRELVGPNGPIDSTL